MDYGRETQKKIIKRKKSQKNYIKIYLHEKMRSLNCTEKGNRGEKNEGGEEEIKGKACNALTCCTEQ